MPGPDHHRPLFSLKGYTEKCNRQQEDDGSLGGRSTAGKKEAMHVTLNLKSEERDEGEGEREEIKSRRGAGFVHGLRK